MIRAWFLAIFVASLSCLAACAQRPPGQAIRTIAGPEFQLTVFDNSDSYSCVVGLNRHGHVIGVRESANEDGTILTQLSWYSDGKTWRDIPLLPGYTNIVAEAISDSGHVVGFASRRIGHKDGSLIAFVWDPKSDKMAKLPPPPGDTASHAQDISADGRRISGYVTGAEPARLRPCVWQFDESRRQWVCTVLETIHQYNPYLVASKAVITPDGTRVAACVTERFLADGTVDSSLYLWTDKGGKWERQQLSTAQMRLHDINNAGVMVGDFSEITTRTPCRIDADGSVHELDFLPGDRSGEAHGINSSGVIVGFSDDPGNPDKGPRAFIVTEEETRLLPMLPDTMYSAAYAINDLGQVGGLADITFHDQTEPDEQTGDPQPVVKSLGFIWTRSQPSGE